MGAIVCGVVRHAATIIVSTAAVEVRAISTYPFQYIVRGVLPEEDVAAASDQKVDEHAA